MPKIVCPTCRKKLRPPDHLAGRRVMCPRCDTVLSVPTELVEAVAEAEARETTTTSPVEDLPFPLAARLGILSAILGMISILTLCVPFVGYLSIGLSSIGLLLGLSGLYRARTESESLPPAIAGGVGIWGGFGTRVRDYPLGGVAACVLALFLVLCPMLIRWASE